MKMHHLGGRIMAAAGCLVCGLAVLALSGAWAHGAPLPVEAPPIEAAPPAWSPTHRPDNSKHYGLNNNTATTVYSIGQPTDDEQQYVEYINRARANPTAEGQFLAASSDPELLLSYWTFSVDLNLMTAQFATNPVTQPLAINEQLMSAARFHTADMFTNGFQGHRGTAGDYPTNRLATAGYSYLTTAENIYSYAQSVLHGHGAFQVDWGAGTNAVGGMQNPPGHRDNIHYAPFREIGVGVIKGNNQVGVNPPVGPQIVTQELGTRGGGGNVPMVTGVAYYDFNGNNFYDPGEGIGGVTVIVSNTPYYAITAESGGYTVPVTTNGSYIVRFTTTGLTNQTIATVSGAKNVKLDFVPTYTPPVVTGPDPSFVGTPNACTFTPVGAATAYEYRVGTLTNYSVVEGAEGGIGNVTIDAPAGYNPISPRHASGTASYHLTHPGRAVQSLTLNPLLYLTSTSQLSFSRMLGYATRGQVARAEISVNDGKSWATLWEKAGSDGPGETSFIPTTVALAAYAGGTAKIRFVYDLLGSSYYPQTDDFMGLSLDNIAVTNSRQVQNLTTNSLGANLTFSVTPATTNQLILSARARINTRTLDWSPATVVAVAAPPPALQISSPRITGSQVVVEFTVTNYRAGMTFQLHRANGLGAAWGEDTSATLSTLSAGSKYRFTTTTTGADARVYKVRGY